MKIEFGKVTLNGNELALAVDEYLTAHHICVTGSRTIRVMIDGEMHPASDVDIIVYVDPSGQLVDNRGGR